MLVDNPNKLFSLSYFCEQFQAAKSTISEDITIVKEALQKGEDGVIHTVAGASGGIKYVPMTASAKAEEILRSWCDKLATPKRIIPGGFLYVADLVYDAQVSAKVGEFFAQHFSNLDLDYVITIETKGIPLAMMTARAFNLPLVIIRDDSKVTEGSSVSINYISGSSRSIKTMSLSRRAIPNGAKVLIIDDFMKAGGTAKGMRDLMEEFGAEVMGMGVFMATKEPEEKLVTDYVALLELTVLDEVKQIVNIKPSFFVGKIL